MSFKIANTLLPSLVPSKNTSNITILSDQEFMMVDNNYLNWIEVTCFTNDEVKILVNNNIKFTKNIYNNNELKKSLIVFNVNEYIERYSVIKLISNSPLQFRIYFSNIKETSVDLVRELDLTLAEYDAIFNNNNYIDVLENIFD